MGGLRIVPVVFFWNWGYWIKIFVVPERDLDCVFEQLLAERFL